MKRNFGSFVLVACIAAIGASASAQEVTIGKGTTIHDALTIVVEAYDLEGPNRVNVTLDENLDHDVVFDPTKQALGMVLYDILGSKFGAWVDNDRILQVAPSNLPREHIERFQAQKAAKQAAPEITVAATEYEARVAEIRKKYPEAYKADGTRGDAVQMLNLQNEIAALNTPSLPAAGPAPAVAVDSRFQFQYGYPGIPPQDSRFMGAANYGYGGIYDPYGYYLLAFDRCVANPRHRDCRVGELRIQGDRKSILTKLGMIFSGKEEWASRVDIVIQGPVPLDAPNDELEGAPLDVMGPVTAIDGIFDTPLRLPSGRYRVMFMLVEANLLLYEQTTRIYPRWDARGKETILRVDHNRFANAPLKQELARMVRQNVPAEKLLGASPAIQ